MAIVLAGYARFSTTLERRTEWESGIERASTTSPARIPIRRANLAVQRPRINRVDQLVESRNEDLGVVGAASFAESKRARYIAARPCEHEGILTDLSEGADPARPGRSSWRPCASERSEMRAVRMVSAMCVSLAVSGESPGLCTRRVGVSGGLELSHLPRSLGRSPSSLPRASGSCSRSRRALRPRESGPATMRAAPGPASLLGRRPTTDRAAAPDRGSGTSARSVVGRHRTRDVAARTPG